MKHLQRFKLSVISLIVAFASFLPFTISGQIIDYKEIKKVALNSFSINSGKNLSNIRITNVIPISDNNEIAYYIFNFEPRGHIVVSNDKAFEPILGYGLSSTIDFASIPPGLKYLLDNFKKEISYTRRQGLVTSKETAEKWDYYLNLDENTTLKSYSTGTYLLQTKWGQGLGYNRFCPLYPNTNNRTIVGCGGVALAQILYYWQCRVFPDNSISYTPAGFPGPISLNFYGQNYNWSGMSKASPDDYNAQLLYHSAVSIRSNFAVSSTTSYTDYARTALVSYFGFNANNIQYKNSYTNDTWINMLKTEINAERPIFYAGYNLTSTPNYGHAWVIDGYKNDNTFHCNWGWYGDFINEWYLLSALNAGSYSFNDGQSAILNIYPMLDACSGLTGSTAICSSNTSYSISIPSSASVTWSKSSNLTQVGGNTSTNYTVYATNSSQSGTGFITSTIYNSQNQVFMTKTKNVWLGAPSHPYDLSGFPYDGMQFPSNSYFNFIVWTQPHEQGANSFEWYVIGGTILSGQSTQQIDVLTDNAINGNIGFVVGARVGNSCGWSPWLSRSGIVYDNGGGGGSTYSIYPNPFSTEITVSATETTTRNNGKDVDDYKIKSIRIFDKMGLPIIIQNYSGKYNSVTINVSLLLKGIYLIKINEKESHTIIKE